MIRMRAKVVCCTSLRDFPDGTPEPYRDEMKRLVGHGLPMICANPDVVFRQWRQADLVGGGVGQDL
jgi:hypothetical protein